MTAGIGTAKPRLLLMGKSLVMVGGRPGNVAWLNPDGMGGDTWIRYPLPSPSASAVPMDERAKRATTSYNGLAAVNETHGVFTFDDNGDLVAVPFALI
jgi:hypothetical protein